MHATSLQGFDDGDVVHQFEKRCKHSLISTGLRHRHYMSVRANAIRPYI
ncbi:MAG: hypothetical protein MGU50_14240 [Trichodesmium sp. MAG_R02]|nr:hypothetical protein [Trichodesmium sp. MAG_R02]